jgi:hypothetical protein
MLPVHQDKSYPSLPAIENNQNQATTAANDGVRLKIAYPKKKPVVCIPANGVS